LVIWGGVRGRIEGRLRSFGGSYALTSTKEDDVHEVEGSDIYDFVQSAAVLSCMKYIQ
jgi:hypothetical protein